MSQRNYRKEKERWDVGGKECYLAANDEPAVLGGAVLGDFS